MLISSVLSLHHLFHLFFFPVEHAEMLSSTLSIIHGFEYSLEPPMGFERVIRLIDLKCCMTAPLMLANMCDTDT